MLHLSDIDGQPATRIGPEECVQLGISPESRSPVRQGARADIFADDLAFRTRVAFRSHSHINNVLTHISGGDWNRVEETLRVIFDPMVERAGLSPLARNILDLVCAERGVTGRILKPYFRAFLHDLLEPELAARIISRLAALYSGAERSAKNAVKAAGESTEGGGRDDRIVSNRGRNECID